MSIVTVTWSEQVNTCFNLHAYIMVSNKHTKLQSILIYYLKLQAKLDIMECITCNWVVLVKFVFFGLVCFRLQSVCHVIRLMWFYFLSPGINLTFRTLLVAKSPHMPDKWKTQHTIFTHSPWSKCHCKHAMFILSSAIAFIVQWLPCLILFIHDL